MNMDTLEANQQVNHLSNSRLVEDLKFNLINQDWTLDTYQFSTVKETNRIKNKLEQSIRLSTVYAVPFIEHYIVAMLKLYIKRQNELRVKAIKEAKN